MKHWVLLHGINNVSRVWQPIVSGLPSGVQAHCPELDGLENIETIAETLIADLPDRFVLIGHSFGGYVALSLLEKIPANIEAIVLINSNCTADSDPIRKLRLEMAQKARQGEYATLARNASQKTFHPSSLKNQTLMAQRESDIVNYGADKYAAHQIACSTRPDRTRTFATFTGKKLVVIGAEDQVISPESQQQMAAAVGAEVVTIDGTGHMLPAEAPDKVRQSIENWLNQTPAS